MKGFIVEKEEIKRVITTIILALCSSHNVLMTDLYKESDIDETHWVSDHSEELELLALIEAELTKSS